MERLVHTWFIFSGAKQSWGRFTAAIWDFIMKPNISSKVLWFQISLSEALIYRIQHTQLVRDMITHI